MIIKEKFDRTLPPWFRHKLPDMAKVRAMKVLLKDRRLQTVCSHAHCPNAGDCWGQKVAAFMILGKTCTRGCRFCSVDTGHAQDLDPQEPQNVALAVKELGLRYAVVTSVTRDDLKDGGALHFAKTIEAIRRLVPDVKIEVLIPDFCAKEASLRIISEANADCIAHNIETVRRLSPMVRPQAQYDRSLQVLRSLRQLAPQTLLKSSMMVGMGETDEEILESMSELKAAGCQILTIGQYLAPSKNKRHWPIDRFVSPQDFERYRCWGQEKGFDHVQSAPLVRSSFLAEKGYQAVKNHKGEALQDR